MLKTVCVVRYGAYGDIIMMTPLLRVLKEDGYHVTVNCSPQGNEMLRHNPHVDKIVIHERDSVPRETLDEYWAEMAKGYDKFINLSESIEGSLLKIEGREDFNWSDAKRHAECDVNYYDRTLEIGGYGHIKGKVGELYLSSLENKFARDYRRKYKDRFMIQWALSGSSYHKAYPHAENVAMAFLDAYPDAMIITTGDELCTLLEWSHPRTKCYSGKWGIRKTFSVSKYCDLVIGAETGQLHAAACFDTPTIVLMSHSSEENLSKYWKNSISVGADVACRPCHKLHYRRETCPTNELIKASICMSDLRLSTVLDAMEKTYKQWRENRDGTL